MGPFLLFFALLACSAAYYEFSWNQQSGDGFQQQIENWDGQLSQLQAENKKLAKQKDTLARQLESARAAEAAQISNATSTEPGQNPAAPTLPPSTGIAPIEDLGTFSTTTGKTYADAKLMKIEPADIVVSCSDGVIQVPYAIMTPDMQKRFGWDPQKSTALNAAVIRYQEQLEAAKEAAAQSSPGTAPTTAPAGPDGNFTPGMTPAVPANP